MPIENKYKEKSLYSVVLHLSTPEKYYDEVREIEAYNEDDLIRQCFLHTKSKHEIVKLLSIKYTKTLVIKTEIHDSAKSSETIADIRNDVNNYVNSLLQFYKCLTALVIITTSIMLPLLVFIIFKLFNMGC